MLVRTVLEHAGYEVTTARDGREAIALLAASDYDVVLLDVVTPNLNDGPWSLVVSPWSLVVKKLATKD